MLQVFQRNRARASHADVRFLFSAFVGLDKRLLVVISGIKIRPLMLSSFAQCPRALMKITGSLPPVDSACGIF